VFQQRRLARPVAADERDHLVGIHGKVDVVHPDGAVGVGVGLTPKIDQRRPSLGATGTHTGITW
jgi:hypothetical protein